MDSRAVQDPANEEDVESNSVIHTQPGRQDASLPCVILQPQPDDVSQVFDTLSITMYGSLINTFPFLLLPPELRNFVYDCPATWETDRSFGVPGRYHGLDQAPITRVNRQLRLETLEFFYYNHFFTLDLPDLDYEYDDNTPQRRDPFNFMSRAIDHFIPRPTSTLRTRNLGFLSSLELRLRTASGKVWPRVKALELTMSREDPKFHEMESKTMLTDGLNWDDEEKVAEAFVQTVDATEVIQLAASCLGNDDVSRGAVGLSREIARILCLVARHCPQLTRFVVITITLGGRFHAQDGTLVY